MHPVLNTPPGADSGGAMRDILRRRQRRSVCPICGADGEGFDPLPDSYRQAAEHYGFVHFGKGEMTALATYFCRRCGASDRERLYAHWLQRCLDGGQLPHGIRVMHFAPEPMLTRYLRETNAFALYETADLTMPEVDHRGVDLTRLSFASASVDFFLCSHVLEHVPDDRAAIAELWRVTKPGGAGLLMAPIATDLQHTIEDPLETSPAQRWRRFGQDDHVRLYAHDDYVARLREGGFTVGQFGRDFFGADTFDALGVKSTSILYVVMKT
jgi:SAM-dependent methyltransferase